MEEITHRKQPDRTAENYQRTKMQEEIIVCKLKEKGCRITKQRQILLNIILQEECASCKEIYYKARKEDARIGAATVYRMINLLEEIGAISRKNMYAIPPPASVKADHSKCKKGQRESFCVNHGEDIVCVIELDDHTICRLCADEWYLVLTEGMKVCGYMKHQNIIAVKLSSFVEGESQNRELFRN